MDTHPVLEVIIFTVSNSSQLSVSMNVCVYVWLFVCLAGLPGHLAAPLYHGGLQEVADQGPLPGSVAEDGELQQEQEVCVDVYMCVSELCVCLSVCVRESSGETVDPSSHKANHGCDPHQKLSHV